MPVPALVLSDAIAGPQPWTGMLLDPARPQPVPIGSLVRSAGTGAAAPLAGVARRAAAPGAGDSRGRIRGPWPPIWTSPRFAHFARELDETAAVSTAMADQGDGPLDVHVIECAVARGYGGDAAAADAVTAWIAETIRRGIPKDKRRAGIPGTPGHRALSHHAERRLVCRWL